MSTWPYLYPNFCLNLTEAGFVCPIESYCMRSGFWQWEPGKEGRGLYKGEQCQIERRSSQFFSIPDSPQWVTFSLASVLILFVCFYAIGNSYSLISNLIQ